MDTSADVVLVFRRSLSDAPEFDVALEVGGEEPFTTPLMPGFSLAPHELFRRD